jgi:ATP-dependent Clp protease ATP-binding subunit ClpB
MNRIDKVIVFRTLKREHLEEILDIELERVQERLMSPPVIRKFVFACAPSTREFLIHEGTDLKFGARHLKRSIERHLVFPISNLLTTRQLELADMVTIDYDPKSSRLTSTKEDRNVLLEVDTKGTAAQQPPQASTSQVGNHALAGLARRATKVQ